MGTLSLVHVAARYNAETSKAFRPEKVSAAVDPRRRHASSAGNVVKES
jgi:hypothetical protein